jgi:hypothetical protein
MRLNTKQYEALLSSFAFSFKLRCYAVGEVARTSLQASRVGEKCKRSVGKSSYCSPRHPPHRVQMLATSFPT